MNPIIFILIMFILWIAAWYISYIFLKKRTSSKTISVGGSFISSCVFLATISLLAQPFTSKNKKEYKKIDTDIGPIKEQIENSTKDIDIQINNHKKIIENKTLIYGETNFPEGTKLGISIEKLDKRGLQGFNIFVRSGQFISQPFTSNGDLLGDDYDVQVFTYFNQIWQPSEKLRENLRRYKSPYLTNEQPMGVKFEVVKRLGDLN